MSHDTFDNNGYEVLSLDLYSSYTPQKPGLHLSSLALRVNTLLLRSFWLKRGVARDKKAPILLQMNAQAQQDMRSLHQ